MTNLHKHSTGVPTLRGNPFYKCPSCLISKLTTEHTTSSNHMKTHGSTKNNKPPPLCQHQQQTLNDPNPLELPTNPKINDLLDDLCLPTAQPGQHFHMDWGFVRGSQFRSTNENGSTITSIDGKNSCLLSQSCNQTHVDTP